MDSQSNGGVSNLKWVYLWQRCKDDSIRDKFLGWLVFPIELELDLVCCYFLFNSVILIIFLWLWYSFDFNNVTIPCTYDDANQFDIAAPDI